MEDINMNQINKNEQPLMEKIIKPYYFLPIYFKGKDYVRYMKYMESKKKTKKCAFARELLLEILAKEGF
jgi:hypothetical protein